MYWEDRRSQDFKTTREPVESPFTEMTFTHVLDFGNTFVCDNCGSFIWRGRDHYMQVKPNEYDEGYEKMSNPVRICGLCATVHCKKRRK